MLTFRSGDPQRPRGHALLFFRDADNADAVWATYLVVAPIQMDLGKYIPAAFAPQLAGQLTGAGPAAYPLPPMPEKIDGGLAYLERLAVLRGDDLLDGGLLRMGEPWHALHPVTDIGAQYAERYASSIGSLAETEPQPEPERVAALGTSTVDVDDLLLQVMPDREKVGRLARLTGTLQYAVAGQDQRLVDETLVEMTRVARHLGEKYRLAELLDVARSGDARSGELAQLYVERCYRMVDEDYAALAELDRRITELGGASAT